MKRLLFFAAWMVLISLQAHGTLWQVGSGRVHTAPSQVSALVLDGDTVEIDAGIYPSDVTGWTANNLMIRGVGGRAHIKSNGQAFAGKAIWVIAGNNTTIEHIEFSECSVQDHNGAGIRQEGQHLTVRNCYFHHNENGILAGTVHPSNIVIEYCEFGWNGYGDGFSHNLYINHVDTLIFRFNYSHHTDTGHELKSRARVNIIQYNRFSNEATGTASRCLDLPNGGQAYLIGNVIEQGPMAPNSNLISFGLEGLSNPGPHQLYLINNTMVNNRSYGRFLDLQPGIDHLKAYNNIFGGNAIISTNDYYPASTDTASNVLLTNLNDFAFTNLSQYYFRLTAASTMLINLGTDPGISNGMALTPTFEYQHPVEAIPRHHDGTLDIGAYEYSPNPGISEYHSTQLLLYPNPANDFLILYHGFKMIRFNSWHILNTQGKVIQNGFIRDLEKTRINLSSLPPGIYHIILKNRDITLSGSFLKI